jgi:hypothetical protein
LGSLEFLDAARGPIGRAEHLAHLVMSPWIVWSRGQRLGQLGLGGGHQGARIVDLVGPGVKHVHARGFDKRVNVAAIQVERPFIKSARFRQSIGS